MAQITQLVTGRDAQGNLRIVCGASIDMNATEGGNTVEGFSIVDGDPATGISPAVLTVSKSDSSEFDARTEQ